MSQEKALTAFAGLMVLLSVLLTQFVHANFMWFTCLLAQTCSNRASLAFAQQRYFLNTCLGLKVNGS